MDHDLEAGLFERSEHGGLRLIGVTRDARACAAVRDRLAAEGRHELRKLEGPVRLVQDGDSEPRDGPDAA